METSALVEASRRLESSLDLWGLLVLVSTGVVVAGLVLEYWHPVWDFVEHFRRPAAAFPWKTFMELIGAILITLGVAGELFFTYRASRVDTRLRENSHRIEALLNRDAANARGEAAEATRENLMTEKALEAERKTRLELEESLAPRVLRIFGKDGLPATDKLQPFEGTRLFLDFLTDPESVRAAEQLSSSISRAKWRFVAVRPNPTLHAPYFDGVIILAPKIDAKSSDSDRKLSAAADGMLDFLHSNKWAARRRPPVTRAELPDDNAIRIIIGFKPSPYFTKGIQPGLSGGIPLMEQP